MCKAVVTQSGQHGDWVDTSKTSSMRPWRSCSSRRINGPDRFRAYLLIRAAAGWYVFFLCPNKALAWFEHSAAQGRAVAAYNAAIMRLERGADRGRAAAHALLERGVALGDTKSRARLDAERARPL